jgi:pimeloyl-ACP methyl ester carboxylesterase
VRQAGPRGNAPPSGTRTSSTKPDGTPSGATQPVLATDILAWRGEHAASVGGFGTPADPTIEPVGLVVPVDTGERIHYLDWGDPSAATPGTPPLLLIHGLGATAWAWGPVARRLGARAHVVAPDMRGHGLSDAPRGGYELSSLAYDALTVMSANGWGRDVGGSPAVVAGHGFGAMVAATMAQLQPASIAGLALVDGGWEDVGEATGLDPMELLASLADPPEVLSSMEAYLADRRDFDPPTWDADQERAARAAVDEKHAGHVAPVARATTMRGAVEAMFSYRPSETLGPLGAPLLVLVAESGSADDEDVRERRLALDDVVRARGEAGSARPRVVRFEGAGHNLMRYRPAEVAAELAWLLEVALTAAAVTATSGGTRDGPG